jgi:hypothetical protein
MIPIVYDGVRFETVLRNVALSIRPDVKEACSADLSFVDEDDDDDLLPSAFFAIISPLNAS